MNPGLVKQKRKSLSLSYGYGAVPEGVRGENSQSPLLPHHWGDARASQEVPLAGGERGVGEALFFYVAKWRLQARRAHSVGKVMGG